MKGSARSIIYALKFQDRPFFFFLLPVLTGEIELCGMHFTCVGFACTSARRTQVAPNATQLLFSLVLKSVYSSIFRCCSPTHPETAVRYLIICVLATFSVGQTMLAGSKCHYPYIIILKYELIQPLCSRVPPLLRDQTGSGAPACTG